MPFPNQSPTSQRPNNKSPLRKRHFFTRQRRRDVLQRRHQIVFFLNLLVRFPEGKII